MEAVLAESEVSLDLCPLLRVVLRVDQLQGMGLGPWLPSDSPGWTGGHSLDQTSEVRQSADCTLPLPGETQRGLMNSWKIKFKRTFP